MKHVPELIELKSFDYLVLLSIFNKKPNQYEVRKPKIAVDVGNIMNRSVTTTEVAYSMVRLEKEGLICNGRITTKGTKELWG